MGSIVELNKLQQLTAEKNKDVVKLINSFVDSSSFVEIDALVCGENELGAPLGEGVVSGFALIGDVQVGVFALNGEVLKGSIGKKNADKISKCVTNAIQTSSPVIAVINTSGARFSEGIEALEGYGKILKVFAQAYGKIPTVMIVKGNNFGMLSYLTAYCDLTVAYDKSCMSTASPLILASQTKTDAAKVGTNAIHTLNGNISVTVNSDKELTGVLTKFIDYIANPVSDSNDDGNRVCKNLKASTGAMDIIAEAFDKASFLELKKNYAPSVITGLAKLNGITVGVVANNYAVNNGKVGADTASKISDLVMLCENFDLPIVNLVNSDGAVKDLCEENGGLIKEIGNMLFAFTSGCVSKIAMITGKATGLAYTAFAAKTAVDYSIAWADAEIGVLDNAAAARLIYAKEISEAKDKEKAEVKLAKAYGEENSSAIKVASQGFIDNVIDPNLSRQYLIAAVQMFVNKQC